MVESKIHWQNKKKPYNNTNKYKAPNVYHYSSSKQQKMHKIEKLKREKFNERHADTHLVKKILGKQQKQLKSSFCVQLVIATKYQKQNQKKKQ